MKDIVITAGTAIGSVLTLAEAVTKNIGCKAYILCSDKKTSKILSSSRYIEQVIYINAHSEKKYIEEIKQWYKMASFTSNPLLYFTTDTSCYYIDHDREWFESNFNLCLPSSNIIKTFSNKGLAEIEAANKGLVVPKTQVIENWEDIEQVLLHFTFPVILKPRATYLKNGFDFKIKVVDDKDEFLAFINEYIENNNELLCQEFIPGGNDVSYYYLFYRNKNGELFESIGKKTLQSTSNGGIMLKGVSEFNIELSGICTRFLKAINYQGIGGIEFKKFNNKYYFIEMNVRVEGILKASEMANIPISLISYYDIAGNKIPVELIRAKQKDGYKYVDFLGLFISHAKNLAIISAIGDMLNIVFNPKVKLNAFSLIDYKPFFQQIISLLIKNKK